MDRQPRAVDATFPYLGCSKMLASAISSNYNLEIPGNFVSSNPVDGQELNEILRLFRSLRISRSALLRARWGTSRDILTPNQIGVLMLLIEHPGGLRIGQLAARESEDAGNVTRAVIKLEEGGYTERLVIETDGRGVVVVATARGRALGKKLIQRRDQFLQETFLVFSTEDRRQLLKFLESINAAIENAISRPARRAKDVNGKSQPQRLARN